MYTEFWWGNLRERDQMEASGVDGRTILRRIFRNWDGGSMDGIELAWDRESWRALVSAVMNHRVPQNARNFLTSCKPVSFSRKTLLRRVSKEVS